MESRVESESRDLSFHLEVRGQTLRSETSICTGHVHITAKDCIFVTAQVICKVLSAKILYYNLSMYSKSPVWPDTMSLRWDVIRQSQRMSLWSSRRCL